MIRHTFHSIFITAVVLSVSNLSIAFDGGNGTAEDPYQIGTADQLVSIGSDAGLLDKHYILTADIDLTDYEFTTAVISPDVEPLNYTFDSTPFTGVFEGDGYKITNLKIDTLSDEDSANDQNDYLSLFGQICEPAVIKNLGIENASINTGISCYFIGFLVGDNYSGIISGCHADGNISAAGNNLGVLVGRNGGDISYCFSEGTISCHNNSKFVGGLIGHTWQGSVGKCYSTVNINNTNGNVEFIGGLIGNNGVDIINSYSVGSVEGTNYLGGLIGNSYAGDVTWCFWDIETSNMVTSAGGFGKNTVEMQTISTFTDAGWDFSADDGDLAVWYQNIDSYPGLMSGSIKEVPDITGLSQSQAQDMILSTGFLAGDIINVYSMNVAEGNVIRQTPMPGQYVLQDTKIDLVVSLGDYNYTGSGTSEDPYEIATAEELLSLGFDEYLLDKHYILTDDIDLSGYEFLTALIAPDLNPSNDTYDGTPYTGVFDGNGYHIKNFTIDTLSDEDSVNDQNDNLGLFGQICEPAVIKNLGVENVSINTGVSCNFIGILAGDNYSGIISGCHADGNISAAGNNFGVLVGRSEGNISSCYSTGVIACQNNSRYIGGLVGHNLQGSIENCYSTTDISRINGNVEYAGGLVGNNGAEITNCYSTGLVEGTDYLGGLIGNSFAGQVTGCFWNTTTSRQSISAGGEGKNTYKMKWGPTFTDAGWDFSIEDGDLAVWYQDINSYPELASDNVQEVPDLIGLTQAEAEALLTGKGLSYITRHFYHDTVDEGEVFDQIPATGTMQQVDFNVVVNISLGQRPGPIQTEWNTLGGNMHRNGQGQGVGPVVGCAKWIYHTKPLPEFPYEQEEDGGGINSSIAIGHNGNVHFGCEDGFLYTLDKDGNFLWKYDVSTVDPVVEGMWQLNETSGPMINDSNGDRDATLHYDPNNLTFTPFYDDPEKGNVIEFDGQEVYIQIDNYKGIVGSSGRQCSMWIKTTEETGCLMYWGESHALYAGIWKVALSGGKAFVTCGEGFYATGSSSLNDGDWHYLKAVLPARQRSFNDIEIFVDEQPESVEIISADKDIYTEYGSDVMIGCGLNGSDKFKGYISDVKICSLGRSSEPMSSVTTDAQGNVYVGGENGILYSIDKDGNKNWAYETGDFIYSTAVIDSAGRMFFGSSNGTLYAIDSDGNDLWSFAVPGPGQIGNSIIASPTIGKDGAVLTGGAYSGILYCLDPVNGGVKWVCDLEEPGDPVGKGVVVSPVAADDGTIYAAMNNDPKLYAIDPNDGEVIWSTNLAYDPDLIAYWKFNEDYSVFESPHVSFDPGIAIDSSAFENNIGNQYSDNYLYYYQGMLGASLRKESNDFYITNTYNSNWPSLLVERTITGWVNYDIISIPLEISWGNQIDGYGRMSIENNKLKVGISGGVLKTSNILNANRWCHFAVVIEDDGPDTNMDDVKIYVNGILSADSNNNSEFQMAPQPFRNGNKPPINWLTTRCLMDDFRIYKKALSVSQIRKLMDDETAPLWTDPEMDDINEHFRFLWTEPVIGPDGTIYTGYDDNYIRAVDPDNGDVKWIKRLGESRGYDLTVDKSGKLYAGGFDGELYVVSPEGEFLSVLDTEKVTRRYNDAGNHFHLGNSGISYPVIDSEGTVYLSDAGNRVWAISSNDCDGKNFDLTYQEFERSNLHEDGRIDLADVAEFIDQWRYCNISKLPCSEAGRDPIWRPWGWPDNIAPDISEQWYSSDLNMDKYVDFADLAQLLELWLVEY